MADPNFSSFLGLPAEIRHEVYRHVLPYSVKQDQVAIVALIWISNGGTSILRVNRFVCDEAIKILYTENTFEITVGPGGVSDTYLAQTDGECTCLRLNKHLVSILQRPIPHHLRTIRHFYLSIPTNSQYRHKNGNSRFTYPIESLFTIDILKEGLPPAIGFLNRVNQISTLKMDAWILMIYNKPHGPNILEEAFGTLTGVGKAILVAIEGGNAPRAAIEELNARFKAPKTAILKMKTLQEATPAQASERVGRVPKERRRGTVS